MQTWTLWSLDVLGNDDDGYEVNDRCCLDRAFELPEDATDAQIVNALRENHYLSGWVKTSHIEIGGDDLVIDVDWAKTGRPLFTLERND